MFAFNKHYFSESIRESINTSPPSEPDDALSWKGSFTAWHTEWVRAEKGSPLRDVSMESDGKDKSSHFVYCGEDNVCTSAGSIAVLSYNPGPLCPLAMSSCKGPSLLTIWTNAEPEHALGSYAALGEKKCSECIRDTCNLCMPLHNVPQPSSGPGGPQGSSRNPPSLLMYLAPMSLASRRECLQA